MQRQFLIIFPFHPESYRIIRSVIEVSLEFGWRLGLGSSNFSHKSFLVRSFSAMSPNQILSEIKPLPSWLKVFARMTWQLNDFISIMNCIVELIFKVLKYVK